MDDLSEKSLKLLQSSKIKDKKGIKRAFFQSYKELADLVGVESTIVEEEWDIFAGFEGYFAARTIYDFDLQELIRKKGKLSIILKVITEAYMIKHSKTNKNPRIDLSPLDPELHDKAKEYIDGLNEKIEKTVLFARPEKIVIFGEPLGTYAHDIMHEAGHVLFEYQSAPNNYRTEQEEKLDNEIFAIFASDYYFRRKDSSLFEVFDNVKIEITSDFAAIAYKAYRTINRFFENDFKKVRNYMIRHFHGERKHLV